MKCEKPTLQAYLIHPSLYSSGFPELSLPVQTTGCRVSFGFLLLVRSLSHARCERTMNRAQRSIATAIGPGPQAELYEGTALGSRKHSATISGDAHASSMNESLRLDMRRSASDGPCRDLRIERDDRACYYQGRVRALAPQRAYTCLQRSCTNLGLEAVRLNAPTSLNIALSRLIGIRNPHQNNN